MTDRTSEQQELYFGSWGADGGRILTGGPEDGVFDALVNFLVPRLGPDFVGYEITHITQDLIVDMQTDWVGPGGQVWATRWVYGGDYEFWGRAVPEPATSLLVLVGVALCRSRRAARLGQEPSHTCR